MSARAAGPTFSQRVKRAIRVRAKKIRPPVPTKVDLPPFPVPEPVPARATKVAVVLDPFSVMAFAHEWTQLRITPGDWRTVLERERPALLFCESAWNGNDGAWRLHMTADKRPSSDLRALVAWCREQGIPTVFWNKEDPPNYDTFIETAKLFDRVFTVDADRIPAYRQDLGHDRIGLLPFAAQPRLHNPVRRGAPALDKPLDVAFAGTWFADKHPERRAQMEYVLGPARQHGLQIWSRMQKDDKRYRFPRGLRRFVVGSLPYEKMLAAYTAYKVFLNVNSVTTSPTMGSRRLFELSAAQTAILSAPAASIEPFFGHDIEVVSDAEQAEQALEALMRHKERRDRMALRAHRRVYDQHLYTHRVAEVLESVGLPEEAHVRVPTVSAVVPSRRPEQLDHVLAQLGRQAHPGLQLVLVPHGWEAPADLAERAAALGVTDVVVRPAAAEVSLGACMNLGVDAADGDLVAKVDDDNLYGVHYLTDLVRALDYAGAEVVGKWAHYVHLTATGANLLRFAEHEHRFTRLVQGGTLLARTDLVRELRFEDLPRRVDTTFLEKVHRAGGTVYAADRFNFVSVRASDPGSHTWTISERELLSRSTALPFYGDPAGHVEV